MLVLNTNSKRQRRPNVRLGEIGDVSAAFACGFSQKIRENFGHKRLKTEFVSPKETEARESSELMVLDPGFPPIIPGDLQHNRENKNPNSTKLGLELASLDEFNMTKSKLDFGTITRKSRVMKRRRTPRGNNNVFGSAWFSKLSPEFSSEDGKECGEEELRDGFTQTVCDEYFRSNSFKDFSDHETPGTSKEACEYDVNDPTHDGWKQSNPNYTWKEDACYEGNSDDMGFGGSDVNTVRRWLEEQGFGKYADVFEMHEVDEEALPLLTLEDLKEMGVFAVGPRRKLYSAIQQLK